MGIQSRRNKKADSKVGCAIHSRLAAFIQHSLTAGPGAARSRHDGAIALATVGLAKGTGGDPLGGKRYRAPAFFAPAVLAANGFIGLNLVGTPFLGMLVGYERSYQGRAAGMRTYGLVCMASTALTLFAGFAPLWYGGQGTQALVDPTRVVQGVVTGIGFLCAGVIMRDGLSIRGLTSAASIWAVSAVGVLLGVGFYTAAILLALLCAVSMSLLHKLERRLPGRATLVVIGCCATV